MNKTRSKLKIKYRCKKEIENQQPPANNWFNQADNYAMIPWPKNKKGHLKKAKVIHSAFLTYHLLKVEINMTMSPPTLKHFPLLFGREITQIKATINFFSIKQVLEFSRTEDNQEGKILTILLVGTRLARLVPGMKIACNLHPKSTKFPFSQIQSQPYKFSNHKRTTKSVSLLLHNTIA